MKIPKATWALALTVFAWASAFPAIRVGLDGFGVAGLSLARLMVASVALAVAAPFLGVRAPRRRDLPMIALCGASGMSAYQVLLNWGEVHVPAGTASLLIAVAPVFSVLLAAAFLGERITWFKTTGSVVAIAGAAVIAVAGGHAEYTTSAWVVLAAAVVQGVYHFATKPLLVRYTGLEVACYAMWAGTLFLLPLLPWMVHGFAAASTAPMLSAVYLGLIPSAVGFVVWGYAVARLSMASSTAALYLVPPVALVVAYVWLGEVPSPLALVGGVLGIAGVALINHRPRRADSDSPTEGLTGEPGAPHPDGPDGKEAPSRHRTARQAERSGPAAPGLE
ncbi:DMT family transporter [Streptomyces griseocarneus]|uniref:DMT family transporter n=1 Tax=Streptomyces griseocarneus TaxID=51201 RepID=UPI00167EF16C|nr:DMT family transporter [Streptomyces griseocarneus]MBZ6475785.1 DMT family transporter [Streptomyces griseocarneus]GHG50799.1 membrane protein [Streptomyces griseocarneus]